MSQIPGSSLVQDYLQLLVRYLEEVRRGMLNIINIGVKKVV